MRWPGRKRDPMVPVPPFAPDPELIVHREETRAERHRRLAQERQGIQPNSPAAELGTAPLRPPPMPPASPARTYLQLTTAEPEPQDAYVRADQVLWFVERVVRTDSDLLDDALERFTELGLADGKKCRVQEPASFIADALRRTP